MKEKSRVDNFSINLPHEVLWQEFARKHTKRNFVFAVLCGIVVAQENAFLHWATILPVFLRTLTGSAALIGFALSMWRFFLFFTQPVAAKIMEAFERKKPFYLGSCVVSILCFVIYAPIVYFFSGTHKSFVIACFFIAYALFGISRGFLGVALFDVMGKSFPENKRSLVLGLHHIAGTSFALFICTPIISLIMAEKNVHLFPYPLNYVTLFLLSSVAGILAFSMFSFWKEPIHEVKPVQPTFREYINQAKTILKEDKKYRDLVLLCVMFQSAFTSFSSFAVLYGYEQFGVTEDSLGALTSMNIIGSITANLIFAFLGYRFGYRFVMKSCPIFWLPLLAALLFMPQLVSFISVFFSCSAKTTAVWLLYFVSFAQFMGLIGWEFGRNLYSISIAPPKLRPTYISLAMVLIFPFFFMGTLWGWIIDHSSYSLVWFLSLLLVATGGYFVYRLPNDRELKRADDF